MSNLRPVAVITGASSGIGAALAEVFTRNGHEVVLVARREAMLRSLAEKIAAKGRPMPMVVVADLSQTDAPEKLSSELSARGVEPAFVVNNAGFGLHGRAADLDRAKQIEMVDLNVRALTDLSLRWIDSLERNRGGILNVASIAAFFSGPGMAVYYATKAYVLSLSEALHRELGPRGIRVSVLTPGPVPTEFQDRAGIRMEDLPGILAVSPEQVAEEAYAGLMKGKRIVTPGLGNRLARLSPRFVPRGLLLAAVDRTQNRRLKKG